MKILQPIFICLLLFFCIPQAIIAQRVTKKTEVTKIKKRERAPRQPRKPRRDRTPRIDRQSVSKVQTPPVVKESTKVVEKKNDSIIVKKEEVTQPIKIENSIPITEKWLLGRWKVLSSGADKKSAVSSEYPNHYLFRSNNIFFLGIANEGAILFNQSGKFKIEDNILSIVYFDFLSSKKPKAQKMHFRILAKTAKTMEAEVTNEKNETFYLHLTKL